MITPERLPEISLFVQDYGEDEEVEPSPPVGVDDLPEEWKAKMKRKHFDSPLMHVVENVELAGPNLAGIKGEDLLLSVGYYGRLDLWERNKPYWEWATICQMIPPKKIECAFSMAGVWSGNYFHWLIDHIPTLQAYFRYSLGMGEEPIVLLSGNAPKFARDFLDLNYIPYIVDDHGHYLVERLIVPTWPRSEGYIRPSTIEWTQMMFRFTPKSWGRRMYITRRNAATRRLINEEAVEKHLLTEGFVTEVMENLTWDEQRSRIAEADYVVGPHGAGLANILLGDRPITIEFVQPNYTNPCCWLIGDGIGSPYGYVVGEQEGKEDMKVDLKKLQKVMEKLQ